MKQELINSVLSQMMPYLNNDQAARLQETLEHELFYLTITQEEALPENSTLPLDAFLSAKKVEGCSEKTLAYYRKTVQDMLDSIGKTAQQVTTDDLRGYLSDYQEQRGAGRVTIDNIRRILSSFFSWLEDEDYILKSPARRIHKVKTAKVVKDTYTDEALERMRDGCRNLRDLAIIDMLTSTGMRVGELVLLNREDINFEERECVVLGKGNKERVVYFDARTKIHLLNYLDSRQDASPALFVGLRAPHGRLTIGGVETMLRTLGKALSITIPPSNFVLLY